jgi:hypothetical protein
MNNSMLKMFGHVKITDVITGKILVDKDNAIHLENLSVAIAQSLIAGQNNASAGAVPANGFIYNMNFGNGGTTVNSSGIITYNPPNVVGSTAQLYNQTYSKIINSNYSANPDTVNNNMTTAHINGKAFTDIVAVCRLDFSEPAGQLSFDNSNDLNSTYAFDELGLFTYSGLMLSHVIFSPVLKSLNRLLDIAYTLRITTLSSLSV